MFPHVPNIVPPSIPDVLSFHKGKHVKGKVVLMRKNVLDFNNFAASAIENVSEFLGQGISLQLVSATKADPGNNLGKLGKPAYLENWLLTPPNLIAGGQNEFAVNFELDDEMGTPGAFVIKNNHPTKFFLVSLTLLDVPNHGDIHFVCNSWIYPSSKTQADRIFFSNKTYLPHETPEPLRKYREQELVNLRGHGRGERQEWERIYDYATYNDLGNPDILADLARPILGGSTEYPYPRRGRTGRPPSKADPNCESRLIQLVQDFDIYVPRDERFGHLKMSDFLTYMLKSISQNLVPVLGAAFKGLSNEFDSFDEVYQLYEGGFQLPTDVMKNISSQIPLPMLKEIFRTDGEQFLKFPTPHLIKDNKSGWMTDEEFGREALAGVNPILIRLLEVFPPQSKLDSNVYGNQSSKITAEDLESNLDGLSVHEALNSNRLFILDHHDAFMPYLRRINEGSYKGYATRTILFLNNEGILRPIAIELSLPHPHGDEYGAVSEVYLPANEGVERSLWFLAKAYVIVNDSCIHQLGSHWLNTHAVIEPFIIATNRQLSALHPIHKLLLPHYRDTMNINALARQSLINAAGIREMSFLPGKYSVEMSSVLYKDWVFTDQALPKDLIKRGMAVEDSSCPHGLRLVIEDYPYANDGLEIWSAIRIWVEEYCSFYYKNDDLVKKDPELQSWWKEVVEIGHADKKNEPWWPKMQHLEDLIEICTIIIWTASALHAAVNFGQYPYGGLILNRPTISRRYMPEKGTPAYDELLKNPEKALLKTITPKFQTLIDLSTIEILSRHTSDEYYLGSRDNPNWTSDEKPLEAFRRFGERLAKIEEKLSKRHTDENLKNRTGPVNLPYTVLHVTSEPGLTFRGIPNSISI